MSTPIRLSDYGLSVFDLGIPVDASWLLKPGEIVVIKSDTLSFGGGAPRIVAHPLGIVWLTHEHEGPEVVAQKSQEWIAKRIENMAVAAIRRIENMYREPIIGIIAEGPMAGLFARQGYDGKVLTQGDFEVAHG